MSYALEEVRITKPTERQDGRLSIRIDLVGYSVTQLNSLAQHLEGKAGSWSKIEVKMGRLLARRIIDHYVQKGEHDNSTVNPGNDEQ